MTERCEGVLLGIVTGELREGGRLDNSLTRSLKLAPDFNGTGEGPTEPGKTYLTLILLTFSSGRVGYWAIVAEPTIFLMALPLLLL